MSKTLKRAISPFILLSIISTSYGDELKLKLKGGFEFQTAFSKNNSGKKQSYITENNKNVGFNTSSNISANVKNEVDNLFEYGAKLGLETTTKSDRRVASSIYIISDYGKFEAGSEKSANAKMKITGMTVACGTAGGWDTWAKLTNSPELVSYITNNGNFLDAKTREMTKSEYSRKITYYTPPYKGFQFGISYIADTTNTGYTSISEPVYHSPVKSSPHHIAFKDGIAFGVTYEYKNSSDYKVKVALVGEKAHATEYKKPDKTPIKKQSKNLNTYTIGAEIGYKQYAVSAGYGNYMKSLTSNLGSDKNKDSDIYSVGGRYTYEKLSASLSLLSSNHKKNKLKALTLAAEYKLAPGLLPYAEITSYNTEAKFLKGSTTLREKVKGVLLLLGLKLEI